MMTTNILQIQREFLGDFGPVKFSDYKLTEFNQAMADIQKLAAAEPGRKFRMVNAIEMVVVEVCR